MKYKLLSFLCTFLGFAFSIGCPIGAAMTQVVFLKSQAEVSVADKIGITASGVAIAIFVVAITLWKYISVLFREKMRSHRTLVGFWVVGYLLILCVKCLFDSLEVIFLGGAIGAVLAVVLFHLSDKCRERKDES